MSLLGEELLRIDADVIGFQEVNQELFSILSDQEWMKKYQISDISFPKYGVMILRHIFRIKH